jgi:hypothetical protein
MRKIMFAGLAVAALLGASGAASARQVVVEERYGHWDPAWGVAPPAPHHSWHRWHGRESAWYGHVHNCLVRYHTYDAHRDMYREGHRWVACND